MYSFSSDNGVIHQNAQHENEAVQREEVYCHSKVGHHREGAHESDRHAEAYPKRHARAQEQSEQHDDAADADERRVVERDEPFLDDVRAVVPDIDAHALGQLRHELGEVILYRVLNLQCVLVARARHVHYRAALTVEAHHHTVFLKCIGDICNLAEGKVRAVPATFHYDFLKCCSIKRSPLRANK